MLETEHIFGNYYKPSAKQRSFIRTENQDSASYADQFKKGEKNEQNNIIDFDEN